MKAAYFRLMDVLHRLCMLIAAASIVIITVVIPWGVFTRYVLHAAASWPEPMAVLLMICFTFSAAALCYRENLHIAVNLVGSLVPPGAAAVIAWIAELLMGAANVFLLVYGVRLVEATWYNAIAEFPIISAGISYLPIPLGGGILVLFVIERFLRGPRALQPAGSPVELARD
jgi:TRAP-type C4-dicarboxylate transport system permease small subunit